MSITSGSTLLRSGQQQAAAKISIFHIDCFTPVDTPAETHSSALACKLCSIDFKLPADQARAVYLCPKCSGLDAPAYLSLSGDCPQCCESYVVPRTQAELVEILAKKASIDETEAANILPPIDMTKPVEVNAWGSETGETIKAQEKQGRFTITVGSVVQAMVLAHLERDFRQSPRASAYAIRLARRTLKCGVRLTYRNGQSALFSVLACIPNGNDASPDEESVFTLAQCSRGSTLRTLNEL